MGRHEGSKMRSSKGVVLCLPGFFTIQGERRKGDGGGEMPRNPGSAGRGEKIGSRFPKIKNLHRDDGPSNREVRCRPGRPGKGVSLSGARKGGRGGLGFLTLLPLT